MLQPGSGSLGSFTGFKAHEFVAHAVKTNCVAVGPRSGQVLATGGDDKRVNVWRIGRASSIWSLTGNSSAIESLRFDPTEEFLVSGSAGGAVKLFDLSAGKMTRHFRGHMSNVTVIDCGSFDRRFVTTGSMDCQVTDVQFSPDGYILASAAADGQAKLWDLRAGKPMHTFQACSGAVRAIRFNPQEFLLAVATSDRTVKLYDIEFMELFCITAPDTCPTRAITFDPDGQVMYCASPSGLRRWSWDNDTASARLEAMGDVPWGKVGAGALHYNADGRQLLAASCASSRVSVWAVDIDTGDPLPPRPQQQQQSGGKFGADTAVAATASTAASPPARAMPPPAGSLSPPITPPEGEAARRGSPPPDPSFSTATRAYDNDAKSASSRASSQSRSSDRAGREEGSRNRDSKLAAEEKKRDASPIGVGGSGIGGMPDFRVLGRQLPLLPTAAEIKTSSASAGTAPATTSPPAPTPSTTVGGVSSTTHGAATPAAEGLAPNVTSGVSSGGGGGVHQNRRSSRAAAVAATVAAVASAKAATDDAVASVSSSGRHRSIGTSISDTLVITAHPGTADGGGVGEAGVAPNRHSDGGDRAGNRHRPEAAAAAAWPEKAPGKDDGGGRGGDHGRGVAAALGVVAAGDRHRIRGEWQAEAASALTAENYDSEHKWHKHVAGGGAVAGVEEDGIGDDKARDRRECSSSAGGVGRGDRGQVAADDKGAGTATCSGATPAFVTNPWSQDPRGGMLRIGEVGKSGGGGDSPPLMGSPEPAPAAAAAGVASPPPPEESNPPLFSSSSRRSPNTVRQTGASDAVVGRSSTVGFPVIADPDAVAGRGPSAVARLSPPGGLELDKEGPADDVGKATNAADILSEVDGGGGGGGGGRELGMTRPRTATRRWDRPGPPGDDEVIGKTLLSRASVTSTLSTRLTHLRMLRYGWADGDISGTIAKLARLERSATATDKSPRAVVADFLWVVPLDGAKVTLEHCLELMPLLEGLWKLDADSCVAAATRCLESIVRRFGGFVRDTLAAPMAAGRVDLAREDRVARCREAHRAFIRGYHHLERSEGEFYEDRRIAAVAERLRPLFESYFMS
eukprot:g9706.t1